MTKSVEEYTGKNIARVRLFSEPDLVNLDHSVLSTEARPFTRVGSPTFKTYR